MKTTSRLRRATIAVCAFSLVGLAAHRAARTQEMEAVKVPDTPLVLKARGSFSIGGEFVERTPIQLSTPFDRPLARGGRVAVNQMYVQFMVPASGAGLPVVMLHGSNLSGKTYETTPDGRMGWDEYFVRRGHAVYVPDQVARGRSGFDIAIHNDVRAGLRPHRDLPNVYLKPDQLVWTLFRFGARVGEPYPGGQFPIEALEAFGLQGVPDLNATLPQPNPNRLALASLGAKLKGAVLMGHSQTGFLPVEAALHNPAAAKALVLLEPGGCGGADLDLAPLAGIPVLVAFGDNLDTPSGYPNNFSWRTAFDNCKAFVARVNAAKGRAEMLHPPEMGIRGNSHMLMQDRNSLQIADLILAWLARSTRPVKNAG